MGKAPRRKAPDPRAKPPPRANAASDTSINPMPKIVMETDARNRWVIAPYSSPTLNDRIAESLAQSRGPLPDHADMRPSVPCRGAVDAGSAIFAPGLRPVA